MPWRFIHSLNHFLWMNSSRFQASLCLEDLFILWITFFAWTFQDSEPFVSWRLILSLNLFSLNGLFKTQKSLSVFTRKNNQYVFFSIGNFTNFRLSRKPFLTSISIFKQICWLSKNPCLFSRVNTDKVIVFPSRKCLFSIMKNSNFTKFISVLMILQNPFFPNQLTRVFFLT